MSLSAKLPPHEWVIIALLIVTVCLLSVVTFFHKKEQFPSVGPIVELSTETIQVTVKGEVVHSGVHEVKRGMRLKELLAMAVTTPEADLSRLKLNSKLREGQVVKVPAQVWITIYLEGAVKEAGPLKLRKGTKVEELLEQITLLPEGDPSKLKKKRLLKDQEVIVVPIKKKKSKCQSRPFS